VRLFSHYLSQTFLVLMMDPVMDPKRQQQDVLNTVVLPTISEQMKCY
jgi:hypothetical protein